MQKIRIIAMGKLTEKYARDAAADYIGRIARRFDVTVVEPKSESLSQNPTENEIKNALEAEEKRIRAEIPQRAYVVAMCVEGKQLSSEELAEIFARTASGEGGKNELCFIIGSSHGLAEGVKKSADLRLSVSKMTFPHELFRVMLLEQVYRAGEINAGTRYHK